MTAIASLLSTTAVTLPGASAPTGVTTLAPFPDLGVAQAVNVAVVPASSGRQAIAGGGNALPVATVDADALAWLDPTLAEVGDSSDQVAREMVVSSPLTAGSARLLPSARATIVSAVLPHAEGQAGTKPATSMDVGASAIALPIAASSVRHATTPALTGAREGSVLADTSASDAAPQPADDDAVGDPQQLGIDQRAGVMPPPIMPPAAMPIVLPSSQASTAPIEQPEELQATLAAPQSGPITFVRAALAADEGASIALSATPQPAHATLPRTVVADEATEPFPLTTAPKHQSYAFTRTVPTSGPTASASLDAGAKLPGTRLAHTATSNADHALLQPASQTGATLKSEPNDRPSDVVSNAAAPLSGEAGISPPAIGAAPATVAPTDAAVAGRTASPRATSRMLPLSVGTPQQGSEPAVSLRVGAEEASIRGVVQAPASAAATAGSVADASRSAIVPEPSRIRGSRPVLRRDERDQASGKTLVAGADSRVSLIGGVPLPVAAVSQMASAISAGDRSIGLSPVLSHAPAAAAPTGTVRGVVSSTTIAPDGVSPILNQAAGSSMPLAIGATAPTIPSPAPSSDAAVSFATPIQAPAASAASVPIANAFTLATPAANEQSGSHLETAPGATTREAAPIALPLRPAPELPAAPLRPTSAPAAQVFAAAIHRALGEQDTRQSRDPAPVSAPLAPAIPGIAAAGAVQQGALDMRHEHWPAAMIERIVTLRDMAAENDTRLRLSPDMLGTIDVSLKRDGDQVQVQITAEQAQTRQLLAEAQPRLAELADARGVKLQLSGGHAGGAGQQPAAGNNGRGDAPRQQTPATPFSTRPRSAEHGATDDIDERIA